MSHSKCDEIQYGCLALGYYVSMWSEIRQASCLDSEMTQVSGLSLLFSPMLVIAFGYKVWIFDGPIVFMVLNLIQYLRIAWFKFEY